MKILHSEMLNTKEFNELSDKIADKLYDLTPDIQEIYEIHINYIEDSWVIDFVPQIDDVPVIKVDTYVDRDNAGGEVLKLNPGLLTDLPGRLTLTDNDTYDLCVNYVAIFEFILALYDFEYKLH